MRVKSLAAALLVALCACRKPASPPSAGEAPTNAVPAEASAGGAQPAANLAELTQAVRKYGVEQQQAPRSLDDLVAKGYLARVPDAPARKKYTITKKLEVVLTDL